MTDSRWQLLREWPPGYGGIERVAHEMATFWRAPVFSLDAQNLSRAAHQDASDPLPVVYPRTRMHGLKLVASSCLFLPGASAGSCVRLLHCTVTFPLQECC